MFFHYPDALPEFNRAMATECSVVVLALGPFPAKETACQGGWCQERPNRGIVYLPSQMIRNPLNDVLFNASGNLHSPPPQRSPTPMAILNTHSRVAPRPQVIAVCHAAGIPGSVQCVRRGAFWAPMPQFPLYSILGGILFALNIIGISGLVRSKN